MTTEEVARACGVSRSTVLRWSKTGVLTGLRLGPKVIRFDRAEVEQMLSKVAS